MTLAVRASTVGSWPGTSIERALDEVASVLGRVDVLPELPARPGGGMVDRARALLADDGPARVRLETDVEAWRPFARECAGGAAMTVCGPWTLGIVSGVAGEGRVDLARALDEAARAWVADVAARVGAAVTPQWDEPLLPHDGSPEQATALEVLGTVVRAGDRVHSCATPAPVDGLGRLGVVASIDVTAVESCAPPSRDWRWGVVATTGAVELDALESRVGGLLAGDPGPEQAGAPSSTLVLTPTCGLGLSPDASDRLRSLAELAHRLDGTPVRRA